MKITINTLKLLADSGDTKAKKAFKENNNLFEYYDYISNKDIDIFSWPEGYVIKLYQDGLIRRVFDYTNV